MSYSLITKCYDCAKAGQCTDRHVVGGAIQAIHAMPHGAGFGHMGYVVVNLDCLWRRNRAKVLLGGLLFISTIAFVAIAAVMAIR